MFQSACSPGLASPAPLYKVIFKPSATWKASKASRKNDSMPRLELPTPLQEKKTRIGCKGLHVGLQPEPRHADGPPLTDRPIEVRPWKQDGAQGPIRKVSAGPGLLPDVFAAMGGDKTGADRIGDAGLNKIVHLGEDECIAQRWDRDRIEQAFLIAFHIANYDRVLPTREDRLQVGRPTTISNLKPGYHSVKDSHFSKRRSPCLLCLERDYPRLWVAQSQPDGVIAFGSADIDNQSGTALADLFDNSR